MKTPPRFLAFFCCCAALTVARAETAPAAEPSEPESSWSVSADVTSDYLFRGVRLAGTSFQPAVEYSRGSLTLGIWSSFALEDRESGDAEPEIDLYGSYTIALGETGLELVPGATVYTYPDAERSNGLYSATFEPSIALTTVLWGVQITPKYYYDVTLQGSTFECTAEVALPLTALGTELDLSASIGTFLWDDVTADADPAEKNWGDYWTIGAAIPYQITPNSSVSLAVTYSEGQNNYYKQGTDPQVPNDAAGGHTAVTLGYSLEF